MLLGMSLELIIYVYYLGFFLGGVGGAGNTFVF